MFSYHPDHHRKDDIDRKEPLKEIHGKNGQYFEKHIPIPYSLPRLFVVLRDNKKQLKVNCSLIQKRT
jgi:hypothetical protein